jgi:hypothetical protein
MFGRDEYYISFLGQPSATGPWMIQFGGHHLGINVTMAGGHGVITPSLPAAQPATYTLNGETIRPLGKENDKAFASSTRSTRAAIQAILNYQVRTCPAARRRQDHCPRASWPRRSTPPSRTCCSTWR